MVAAGSGIAVDVFVTAALLFGPLLAVAIYWFGLRSARKHDERGS